MKKKRVAAGALALVVSAMACGCGDQLYELTEEEQAIVVQFSAHAVSKFNKRQTEGVEDVTALKAKLEQDAAEEEQRRKEEEQQAQQEKPQAPENAQGSAGTADDAKTPEASYVSLGEALGLNGIEASYSGYETVQAYRETQSFIVSAENGKELLVLHVNLKNSGDRTAKCNILSKMPVFMLTINEETSVNADTTILLNDLSTYQGNIKAGDTEKTVLVFQVKKGMAKKISSMALDVTIGTQTAQVQLAGN